MDTTKHFHFFIFLFFNLMFFTSCAVGPDYKKPEIDLPENLVRARLLDKAPNDKKEVQDENNENYKWWDSLNDPLLKELIENSSTSNLTILQAVERIEQARAATRQTFFGLFPTPSVFGQYLKNKTAAVRFPGIAANGIQFEVYTLGLEANWELDLFGKIRRAVESDASAAVGAVYSLEDSIRMVQAQIATAYIQLRGAQVQRNLTRENIARQKSILELIEKRNEVGDSSPFDTERARALTARTEAVLSQFDALISMNVHRLAALSGEFSHDLIKRLEVDQPLPTYDGPTSISSPAELIRRRPDVKVVEQSLHSATAEIGIAVADLFPQVSFSGSLSQEGRRMEDWFTSGSNAYNYGPRFSWSILNLGAILNNIKVRRAVTRERLLNYKEVIILVLEEVENTISELSSEIDRSYHLERAFSASKEAERIAELKYKEGLLNYLDLLTAQQESLETESELADSKTKKALSYVSLFRVLGGAWEN